MELKKRKKKLCIAHTSISLRYSQIFCTCSEDAEDSVDEFYSDTKIRRREGFQDNFVKADFQFR